MPVPDWLNKDMIAQCLQGEGKEDANILVTYITVIPAVPAGNNYGSDIFRVRVELKTPGESERSGSRSLIVKAPPADPARLKLLGHLVKSEPLFYNHFLPAVNRLTSQTFAPMSFPASLSNVVVLEDLKEQGFEMADCRKLLDFDHCRMYAVASATFHATSVAVLTKNVDMIKMFIGDKFFSNEIASGEQMRKIWSNSPLALAKRMAKIEEFRGFADLINHLKEDLWDMMVDAYKPCESLNALIQGDPWTSNMMFSYGDSGEVKDIKLLDFQGVSYASPVGDLVYFIWTSATHEVREHHLERLYRIYCDTFNAKLEELGCSVRMTRELFREALDRYKIIALAVASNLFPCFVFALPIDIDSLCSDPPGPHVFDRYYDDTFCTKHLTRLVLQLRAFGVFDYLEKRRKRMKS